MKFTKFDYLQLGFNILLITATVLNVLYLSGILPQWVTFVGLCLAIGGCIMTNIGSTTGNNHNIRTTVSGNRFLAGLTYVTGIAWVLTYGIHIFFNMGANIQ